MSRLVLCCNSFNWVALFGCLLLSVGVQAEEMTTPTDITHYILLGTHDQPQYLTPYEWMTHDRATVMKGITNNEGHAFIKQASGVSQYYLVLWNDTQFPVTIKQTCWQLPQQRFDQCIEMHGAEITPEHIAEKKEQEAKYEKKQTDKLKRMSWVFDEIKPTDVNPLMNDFLKAHQIWLNNNKDKINAQIATNVFECKHLSAEIVDQMQILGPNTKGRLNENADQIIAAKNGNWVAASNLVSNMLFYDEDWEGAKAMIAWMIKHDMPSAYDNMADLALVTGSYELGSPSAQSKALIEGLLWHGAMLGSYRGQEVLADFLNKYKHEALATTVLACGTEQRAKYGR